MPERDLILASGSVTRARILRDAGLTFQIEKPRVDEEAVKQSLRAEGRSPREQADALAEVKALSVSNIRQGFVIGADQMLAFEGKAFDKPHSRDEAKAQLKELRGEKHELVTAIVIAKDGAAIWRHMDRPRLTMRPFTDEFLEAYLHAAGEGAMQSVGGYQLEGQGAQLFAAIEGDYFSILGVPLLPLLDFLRENGLVAR